MSRTQQLLLAQFRFRVDVSGKALTENRFNDKSAGGSKRKTNVN